MSTEENKATLLDLDALENLGANTFDAAPEFIEPPDGRYKLKAVAKTEKYTRKDSETQNEEVRSRIRITYTIVEVLELADKKALVPPTKSLFSETFNGDTKGIEYWKTRAQGICGDLGTATIKEVNAAISEMPEFIANVRTKETPIKDKDGKDTGKFYKNINVNVIRQEESK